MRHLLLAALLIIAHASSAEPLRLQLKWLPQAQFAGYYVAEAKGFYAEAGLEVEILPGGTDFAPTERLAAGGADISVEWFTAAMTAREYGLELVNIAQPFARSGFAITCLRTRVPNLARLNGATIGIWSAGNEYPAIALLASAGLTPSDVTMVPQEGLASTLLLENKADCVSTMSYNEARELSDAGLPAEDLIAYDAEAFGTVLLDDGLYIRGDALVDPAFAEKLDAFVAASMKGWTWAMANPEGAAGIVIDLAGLNQNTLEAQVRMMKGVSDLIGEEPVMDPTAFAKAADLLVDAGLISMVPDYDAVVINAP